MTEQFDENAQHLDAWTRDPEREYGTAPFTFQNIHVENCRIVPETGPFFLTDEYARTLPPKHTFWPEAIILSALVVVLCTIAYFLLSQP